MAWYLRMETTLLLLILGFHDCQLLILITTSGFYTVWMWAMFPRVRRYVLLPIVRVDPEYRGSMCLHNVGKPAHIHTM
jgi:hypothetical protein